MFAAASPARGAEVSVLRVGTSGDYAPFAKDGKGFDVDVARSFAADSGLAIEWVRFRWPDLREALAAGAFDVAMSGVTWRPEREVIGQTTRAVAVGGPCTVGAAAPRRLAVNRGGVLEPWARRRFPGAAILAVGDNASLAERLSRGEVEALVTDSFEAPQVAPPGATVRCEPRRDRKVYWLSPSVAADLAPRLDAWLAQNEPRLRQLRARWFGESAPRDELDHLVDLLARRLEMMPSVAAWKRAHGEAIEDPAREARVIARARDDAAAAGLAAAGAEALARTEIELAKAVQRRASGEGAIFDLENQVRPALSRLDTRIVRALGALAPIPARSLTGAKLAPLEAVLDADEIVALRGALLGVLPRAEGRREP